MIYIHTYIRSYIHTYVLHTYIRTYRRGSIQDTDRCWLDALHCHKPNSDVLFCRL